jgi:hypothetical protein
VHALPEEGRATARMAESGPEGKAAGLALDYSNALPVAYDEKAPPGPPGPLLFLLDSNGHLGLFHVVDRRPPAAAPNEPPPDPGQAAPAIPEPAGAAAQAAPAKAAPPTKATLPAPVETKSDGGFGFDQTPFAGSDKDAAFGSFGGGKTGGFGGFGGAEDLDRPFGSAGGFDDKGFGGFDDKGKGGFGDETPFGGGTDAFAGGENAFGGGKDAFGGGENAFGGGKEENDAFGGKGAFGGGKDAFGDTNGFGGGFGAEGKDGFGDKDEFGAGKDAFGDAAGFGGFGGGGENAFRAAG